MNKRDFIKRFMTGNILSQSGDKYRNCVTIPLFCYKHKGK